MTQTKDLEFDSKHTLTLNYLYKYEIDLDRIETERDLLAWMCHLCEKSWMTTERVRAVAVKIAEIKGFDLYGL
jgi:hypothetical protein